MSTMGEHASLVVVEDAVRLVEVGGNLVYMIRPLRCQLY